MPKMPPRPCTQPGCKQYAVTDGRCDNHKREAWASNKGKTRHERGYGHQWDKIRKSILRRDSYLCQPCKRNNRVTKADQVDHIRPKSQGGGDNADNLQSICYICHKLKTQEEAQSGGG